MKYIIDSNSFITPHRGYSPIDVAESLWNKLKSLAGSGKIFSIDKVKEELYLHDDELKQWMRLNMPRTFFLSNDGAETIAQLGIIVNWAQNHSFYTAKAKQKFLRMDKADIYLAAFASAAPEEWTVVSMERPAPNNAGEIKLPDACCEFGVHCIMLQDMFRELGEKY